MNTDLIEFFMGKTVEVKIHGYTVRGRLCSFLDGCEFFLLLLWSKNNGFTLINGNFDSLGETQRV